MITYLPKVSTRKKIQRGKAVTHKVAKSVRKVFHHPIKALKNSFYKDVGAISIYSRQQRRK